MANSRIGIELDGTRATIVDVVEGFAVSSRTVIGESAEHALTLALAGQKPTVPVRVALVTPGTNMRRIDVTPACRTRFGFEEEAYKAIPVSREGTTAAGIFFTDPASLVGDALAPGVAVVAPEAPVHEVYRVLGKRPSEVVAPAFTFEGFDGVHLAVRWSNADVTLVVDGRTVAYRQLRVGGLSAVEAVVGAGRLDALLAGTSGADLAVEAELDKHLAVLAAEARQTLDHWRRGGDEVANEVLVVGAGASAPRLEEHLTESGLTRVKSEDLAKLMTYLTVADRPQAVGAFLAGHSYGAHAPQSVFANPYALARTQAAQASAKRAKRLAVGSGVLVAAVALFLGPVAAGKANVASAENELYAAEDRLAAVSAQDTQLENLAAMREGYESEARQDPKWSALLAGLYTSAAPDSIQISKVHLENEGSDIEVELSAASTSTDYAALTSWMNRLRSDLKAEQLLPEDFAIQKGNQPGSTFSLTFTVPSDLVVDDERSLEAKTVPSPTSEVSS